VDEEGCDLVWGGDSKEDAISLGRQVKENVRFLSPLGFFLFVEKIELFLLLEPNWAQQKEISNPVIQKRNVAFREGNV